MRHLVTTTAGQVEIVATDRGTPWVLYFHGGHETALIAFAAELYSALGYSVLAVSRPGYGATNVGPLSPQDFAAVVEEVRTSFGWQSFLAVVGTSFGGPQAVAYASGFPSRLRSLILHSAAPSSRSYPDKALQRLLGPIVFQPRVERLTWKVVCWLMHSSPDLGLRLMMRSLSTHRTEAWLEELDSSDRQSIRDMFCAMRSGSGFNIDVHYAGPEFTNYRRRAQQEVACATLITASRFDAGVAWHHAEDFLATIPNARLVEIPAASHLFWIGPTKPQLISAISEHLTAVHS